MRNDEKVKKEKKEEKTWIILVSGAVGGLISRTLTAPLDRLKIILQSSHKKNNPQYQQNVIKSLINMYKENRSLKDLFKGNGTNCLKIAPEIGLKFLFFEKIQGVIYVDKNNGSFGERLVAGGLAGALTQVIIYPLEITKTRLAVNKHKEKQTIQMCLAEIRRQHGLSGMYKGFNASIMGILPYTGIDLAIYSILRDKYIYNNNFTYHTNNQHNTNNTNSNNSIYSKNKLNNNNNINNSPPLSKVHIMLVCGAISSSIAQFVSYPFAIVKTKLQIQGMYGFEHFKFDGIIDCFQKIYSHEGIKGFYKGIVPNFYKNIPAVSISYMIYENTKSFLNLKYNHSL